MMNSRNDATSVIQFVKLVEKNPCLWNHTLKTYNKTEVTSAAWKEIAEEIKDTEKNCRDRWKNIRTAFGRSLRPYKSETGIKLKKNYYLSEHMAFLIPYLKGGDLLSSKMEDYSADETSANEDSHAELISVDITPNDHSNLSSEECIGKPPPPKSQKLNKSIRNEVDNEFLEWTKSRKEKKEEQDADELFFRSLLLDFKRLSDRRKRRYKLEAMSLLNNLLEEEERETSGPSVLASSWHSTPS